MRTVPWRVRTRLAAQPLAAAIRPASLTAAPCFRNSFASLSAAEDTLKNFCKEHGIPLTLKEGKGPMGTDANRESYDDEAVASSGGDGLGPSCGSAEDKGDDAAKDADDSGESENLAGSDSDYKEAGENVDVHGCKYVGISWVEAEQKFRVRRNWKGTRHLIGR